MFESLPASSEAYPLVGIRGPSREQLLARVKRSKELVKDFHERRAREQALRLAGLSETASEKGGETIAELMRKFDPDTPAGRELREKTGSLADLQDEIKDLLASGEGNEPPDPYDFEQLALIRLGFPPDFWLPSELAKDWHGDDYPKHASREAVEQWLALMKNAARLVRAAGRYDSDGRILDTLAHNAELLRRHDPRLVSADDPNAESENWITVSDAGHLAVTNTGVITRAANKGDLKTNGKEGSERRIWLPDLNRWVQERRKKPEPAETDVHVEKLVKKHVRD